MTRNEVLSMDPERFAEDWTLAVVDTSYVPMSRREVQSFLGELSSRLSELFANEPFDPSQAAAIGAKLVQAHFTAPEALGNTLQLLGKSLGEHLTNNTELLSKLIEVLSQLGLGFTAALRTRTFEDQETMKQAMWLATDVAQRKLRESEQLFHAIFEYATVGIGIGTPDGTILLSNVELQRLLGYRKEELADLSWQDLVHPDDLQGVIESNYELLEGNRPNYRKTVRLIRKNGEEIWTVQSTAVLLDSTNTIDCLVSTIQDATDLHFTGQTIAALSTTDPVTGLFSRATFDNRVAATIDRAHLGDRIALCALGIDGFSAINDGLGMSVGDEVLVAVAGKIKKHAESKGMLAARIGNDEFALFAEKSIGTRTIIQVLEEIIQILNEPVIANGHHIRIQISAGVVERPAIGCSSIELIGHAATALRWAKQAGKAQWMLFDEQRFVHEQAEMQLVMTLPVALDNDEFLLEYQPIVGLTDGKMLFVEAVLRWDHPEHGLLSADDFLDLAEEHGLVMPVAEWALAKACAQAQDWCDRFGVDAPIVSIKITKRQARDPEFFANVIRAIDAASLNPAYLQLELTDHAICSSYDAQSEDIEMLAERGVRFCINGFGSHDLGYLSRLPLHGLKSRRLVVEQIAGERDPLSAKAVTDLVALARMMDLEVIAEGVDNTEQAEWLREIGVRAGQGNAFGGLCSAEDIEPLFGAK